jgi:hypothetical protein
VSLLTTQRIALACGVVAVLAGCSSSSSAVDVADASAGTGDAAPVVSDGASPADDAGSPADDGQAPIDDAGYPLGDGAFLRADRFVTSVVSFTPTACTGYGQSLMPGIVEGPPVGGGTDHGSTDVVSLGSGGSIVVSFAPNAIVDGPGADFIVFENPFWIGGNPNDPYAEPGEVSVSDDGVTWTTFPCTPTVDPGASDGTGVTGPYGSCGGWQVVYSAPGNGVSPVDPTSAGGLALDLASVGVTRATYVRIVDQTHEACPEGGVGPNTNGFDLDAIAIVNAAQP